METGSTPRSVSMLEEHKENDRCLSWFSQFDSFRRSRMCVCGWGERLCSGETMGNVDWTRKGCLEGGGGVLVGETQSLPQPQTWLCEWQLIRRGLITHKPTLMYCTIDLPLSSYPWLHARHLVSVPHCIMFNLKLYRETVASTYT